MVEKISVQIQLEGAAEIERQLADVGKAGQQCFADITAAAEQAGGFAKLDPTILTEKFKQFGITASAEIKKISAAVQSSAQLEATVLGVAALEQGFKKASVAAASTTREIKKIAVAVKSIGRLETLIVGVAGVESGFFAVLVAVRAVQTALTLGPLGLALAAISVAVVALTKLFLGSADAISKIDAEAIKLGASVEQFSKLQQALEKAGIPTAVIAQGLQHLRTEIDRFKLDRVQQALEKASQSGGATAAQLKILRDAANDVGPAAEAARKGLETLGTPFRDTVTPAFESMVRWAGSAAKAIPLLAGELSRLGTSGERARFIALTFERIAVEAGGVVPAFEQLVRASEKMPDSLERNNAILKIFGDEMGTKAVQALRTGGLGLEDFIQKNKGVTQETANTANTVEQNLNKIKTAFSEALTTLPLETVARGLQTVAEGVQATADKLGTISWDTFTSGASTAFTTVNNQVVSLNAELDVLIGKINDAFAGMSQLNTGGAGGGGGSGGGSNGLAGGGLLGGRGSGTSDSNLAWVSRGEHIMPARAVAQPGVLALLEALRRSGGNLAGVLDGMGRFALGGMVPRAMPAFASGGLVGSQSRNLGTLTLGLPDGTFVSGLTDERIASALHRTAALGQVRSGGRKPSRYG